ncbi:MAG: tetratricopeptide repeat protein, partial [Thermodesulfobacteriota bacterium]|nr:tetratricopeptide repeat protein [Thermodesulfobacteriota bacterium]
MKATMKRRPRLAPLAPLFLASLIVLFGCESDAGKFEKHMARGREFLEAGKTDEAILEFKNAAQINANDPEVYHELGEAFL